MQLDPAWTPALGYHQLYAARVQSLISTASHGLCQALLFFHPTISTLLGCQLVLLAALPRSTVLPTRYFTCAATQRGQGPMKALDVSCHREFGFPHQTIPYISKRRIT